MNNYIQEYIDSINAENSKKVTRHVFKKVEFDNIEELNLIQLEQLIINTKPRSPKEIITTVYVLSSYAKWLKEHNIISDDNVYQMLQSLDKKLIWKKAKPYSKKKFISHKQFEQIVHDIALYEEYNALYYETLFRAIYEGIYNEDLSVIKNLRKCDIDGNIVTLKEDNNHIYKLRISDVLAKDLKQLADIDVWERPNRYSVCKVGMRGLHSDSVFKIEDRNTASNDSYKFTFYAKLRKIAKTYVEHSLLPLQLYTSGIMYRIKKELENNDITLEEAFSDNNRNRICHSIISKELLRCNSGIELGNFRELVKGHIDSF